MDQGRSRFNGGLWPAERLGARGFQGFRGRAHMRERHPSPMARGKVAVRWCDTPMLTSAQLFEARTRDFLAFMYDKRLKSVQTLHNHLVFRSELAKGNVLEVAATSEVVPVEAWPIIWEHEVEDRLRGYLNGVGHPDHPDVRAAVGEERFVREAGDPLLRARLFLQMISGNDLIPVTEDWELEVRQAL